MTTVADGDVTRCDIEQFLDAMAGSGALIYRKLFDGRFGETSMSSDDILALGVRMRTFHRRGPVGPLAMVGTAEQAEKISRLLGILAAADRPMRVFQDIAPARRWIEMQTAP